MAKTQNIHNEVTRLHDELVKKNKRATNRRVYENNS